MTELMKLISIVSTALCDAPPQRDAKAEGLLMELEQLLTMKNGFYGFANALHVFPSRCETSLTTLEAWNAEDLWKNHFPPALRKIMFFAEDLFGFQFGIDDRRIVRFFPETGETEHYAHNLNGWAAKILDSPDYEVGYRLAVEWQRSHGSIPTGMRLFPKTPFVVGGQYTLENLFLGDSIENMHFRADLFRQIKNLPDGAQVELKVQDDEV